MAAETGLRLGEAGGKARQPVGRRRLGKGQRHQVAERPGGLGGEVGDIHRQRLPGNILGRVAARKCTPSATGSVLSTSSVPGAGVISAQSSSKPNAPGNPLRQRRQDGMIASSPCRCSYLVVAAIAPAASAPLPARGERVGVRGSNTRRSKRLPLTLTLSPAEGAWERGRLSRSPPFGQLAGSELAREAVEHAVDELGSSPSKKAWATSMYSLITTRGGTSLRSMSSKAAARRMARTIESMRVSRQPLRQLLVDQRVDLALAPHHALSRSAKNAPDRPRRPCRAPAVAAQPMRLELLDHRGQVGLGQIHLVERLHGREPGLAAGRAAPLAAALRAGAHPSPRRRTRARARSGAGRRAPHRRPCRRARRGRAPGPALPCRPSRWRCRAGWRCPRPLPSASDWRCCTRCRSARSRRG